MECMKTAAVFLAAAMSICAAGFRARAAEQTADGVRLAVSADKPAYRADENITFSIILENNSGRDLTDITVKSMIPADYRAADGSNPVLRSTYMQAGGSLTGELVLIPERQSSGHTAPQTTAAVTEPLETTEPQHTSSSATETRASETADHAGNDSAPEQTRHSGKVAVFLAIAAALSGGGFLLMRKGKGKSLVIVCCIAAGGMLYPASDVRAAESEAKSFSVRETVTVDGRQYDLTAEVSFTMETEDMQAAVAEYYEDNSEQIISVEEVEEKTEVFTEKEAIRFMAERGFTEYPLTFDYNMDGSYADETEASPDSDAQHPMYQTYFAAEDGSIWTVFIVGKMITANPASYNLQSDLDTQVLVSETETLTSYTEMGNKLYTTIPKDSAVRLKIVDQITSKKLNEMTYEEVMNP